MMKEHLKTGYYFLQKILRKDAGLLEKIRRERLVTVLNLHQVSPRENPFWSPLKPEIFDDLLGRILLRPILLPPIFRQSVVPSLTHRRRRKRVLQKARRRLLRLPYLVSVRGMKTKVRKL